MNWLKLTGLCSALLFSSVATADFAESGELELFYPTGSSKKLEMPLAYTGGEYDHIFQVGKMKYNVSGQPEKYSFAVVLQKNNYVWVQEFAKGYFESFDWNIGDYKIRLYKEILAKPVMGDYILSINDTDYFFSKKIAQLTFIFDENGIKEIEVDGMVASLGLNKAKTECPDDPEAEKPAEGCEAKDEKN